MNKQRKVVITVTYNDLGMIVDTKAEELNLSAQPNLQPTCNQLATDCISRQAMPGSEDLISRRSLIRNILKRLAIEGQYYFTAQESVVVDCIYKEKSIESAQPEQQWIPCKKQMPEPDSWAIWCSRKGLIQVARWKEDAIDHFWPGQGFFELEDAVAWIPLPEPYREEECDEPDKQTD